MVFVVFRKECLVKACSFRNGRSSILCLILAVEVKVDLEVFHYTRVILISFILKSKPLGAAFSALAFISRVETGGTKVIGGGPPMPTAFLQTPQQPTFLPTCLVRGQTEVGWCRCPIVQ